MNNKELYKAKKQLELIEGFEPIIEEIKNKYDYNLDFYVDYSTILIKSKDKLTEKEIVSIAYDLIKLAMKNLNEEYCLPLKTPAIISTYPAKRDTAYHWLLERKLKENEPKEEN